MRQFSAPLTLSPSISGNQTHSSKREPDQHPKCDLATSNSPQISPNHSNHPVLASIIRSNSSPLVISTNLPSSDSPPSSPDSLASPPNPASPVTPFSQSWLPSEDKKSLPWDVEDNDDQRRVSSSTSSSEDYSPIGNLLVPGDLVCHGGYLQSEPIQIVTVPGCSQEDVDQQLGEEFEVVRRLGAGSYAVVHLVREVLSRPQSDLDHSSSMLGHMDLDSSFESASSSPIYGREYAIKCLSKANLEDSDLAAQMIEATIHQSLSPHPNIVTLHRTFETPSFLLLLLEYVPGEDLYYFLSRARDRYEMDPVESSVFSSCTPPTPGLLSTINPSQLLSTSRLRLISSMFSQICDAVEFCHSNGVYHRDIKPENLIVTDSWVAGRNGGRERKVVVKLSDFGLACTEEESADMDCGSAPYMSYECRNNLSPKYRPRGADIWSLGIVLLNMLYHRNPWTDTAEGACISFTHYRHRPVAFLMQRFTGMKRPVAEFLANRVFCILQDPLDDSSRVSAKEFGLWVKDLPRLLLPSSGNSRRMPRPPAATEEHPLGVSMPPSHRPSSRNSSYSSVKTRTPVLRISALHEFSLQPTLEQSMDDLSWFYDPELDGDERPEFDSTCQKVVLPALPPQTRISALTSSLRSEKSSVSSCPTPPSPTSATTPTVSKKSSIWRLGFGKSSSGPTERLSPASATPAAPVTTAVIADSVGVSATASNVTSLIMGLSPTDQTPAKPTTFSKGRQPKGSSFQSNKKNNREPGQESIMSARYWSGPKTAKAPHAPPPPLTSSDAVTSSATSISSGNWRSSMSSTSSLATSNSAFTRFSNNSSRSVATAATSVSASSWRSGPKPTSTLSPSQQKTITPTTLPRNVKIMTGVPHELGEMSRNLPSFTSDYSRREMIYGSPPLKQRRGMAKANQSTPQLDTITERPRGIPFRLTDDVPKLDVGKLSEPEEKQQEVEDVNVHKKVQKGQINTLAKMLSALRR